MNSDLLFVGGVVLIALALLVLPKRIRNGRMTAGGVFVLVLGGALVIFANAMHPEGYGVSDVPRTFERVMFRVVN